MSFTFDSVSAFPAKLKQCFSLQPWLYQASMDTIKSYASAEIDTDELLKRLTRLMVGHPGIIKEFSELFPNKKMLDPYIEAWLSGDDVCNKVEPQEYSNGEAFNSEDSSDSQNVSRDQSLGSVNCYSCLMNVQSCSEIHLNKPRDDSFADIAKYGTFKEFAFFDKVRRLMGNDETYLNFMRCLNLYTKDIITGSELIDILQPFTVKDPELSSELRSMIGSRPESCASTKAMHQKSAEDILEIDYASCKKHGVSYRPLPSSFPQPFCLGRSLPGNEVCDEVLNDTWVSFPLWSEDSTFGDSKISQYEEFQYRCEDERFELDVVIDSMASTVQLLEDAAIKLTRMTAEEAKAFQLDNCLGGSSELHPRKSIERLYGDKVGDVIESLMHRPCVAVPIVLRRLKSRIEEFREAKKNFIKVWKDECDKNYAKWLQSQATTFRQLDARQMRTKTLINEAEVAAEETFGDRFGSRCQEFVLPSKSDVRDATNLIIHYLNFLPTVQTDDSFRISQLLHDTLPQLISMQTPKISNEDVGLSEADESNQKYAVMYTNSGWYIFLRHFHMFCKRIEEIRLQCELLQRNNGPVELAMRNGGKTNSYYEFMLTLMQLMIEGAIDGFIYETDMQKVLGANAYKTFSVEKILHNIFKQLQQLVSDDLNKQLMEMFTDQRGQGAAGGRIGTAYQRELAEHAYRCRVLSLISDDYCFKIVFFKYRGRFTMELVDPEADTTTDEQLSVQLRNINYVDQYLDANDSVFDQYADDKPVFLARNLRRSAIVKPDDHRRRKLFSIDKTRCFVGSGSFKITFASGSWSFLYRDKALSLARKTCNALAATKRQQFYGWWSTWKSHHISSEQERRASHWLQRSSRHIRTVKSRLRVRHLAKTVGD